MLKSLEFILQQSKSMKYFTKNQICIWTYLHDQCGEQTEEGCRLEGTRNEMGIGKFWNCVVVIQMVRGWVQKEGVFWRA